MNDKPETILFFVDSSSLAILWSCVKHLEPVAEKRGKQVVVKQILEKLAEARDAEPTPFNKLLSLSPEEGFILDMSLQMTMASADLAKKYGDPPTSLYNGDVKLSDLAIYIPQMAELARKLTTATQLANHEYRISTIEKHLGITPKRKII